MDSTYHLHMKIHQHIYNDVYLQIYNDIYTCIYIYVQIHVYIYIHTCIQMHNDAYSYVRSSYIQSRRIQISAVPWPRLCQLPTRRRRRPQRLEGHLQPRVQLAGPERWRLVEKSVLSVKITIFNGKINYFYGNFSIAFCMFTRGQKLVEKIYENIVIKSDKPRF